MDDLEHTLQDLIDVNGLSRVVDRLALACFEKAEHLRSNWKDEPMAKCWDRAAERIDMMMTGVDRTVTG